MSRVGKMPVKIPQGVKIKQEGAEIKIEGPKGKLSYSVPKGIDVAIGSDQLQVTRTDLNDLESKSMFGVARTVLANQVHGVHQGFQKTLEINGVGYRAAVKGKSLNLTLGFSHPVEFPLPEGVNASVEKNTTIHLNSADKVLLGEVAAKIRGFRPPEPYQGKGVKYSDERILRKQGKAAGAK